MPEGASSVLEGVERPLGAAPPVYLTELVGRDRHVDQVATLLGSARLVSLVGPGGTGKTRLAAAVADAASRDGVDVGWVDLTALADPRMVGPHVASTLGLREHPGRSVQAALVERLSQGARLLVLDNCEHVLGACSELATALLRGCPPLRILATGREPLRTPGEKAWRVPPLEVPSSDEDGADAPSVRLFVLRAADAVPSFAPSPDNLPAISRICRRLDGLPLAIELAAARVPVMPPAQLADRLDDMFRLLSSRSHGVQPRHRTLRALVDWSYDLLTPIERTLFESAAVFVGGFTLEAVEEVVCAHCAGGDILDLVATLVDKSLLVMRERDGEARYSMLETVRRYALEKLEDPLRTAAARRLREDHARYFAGLVETLAVPGPGGSAVGHGRIEPEHDNVRAALDWSLSVPRVDLALRLCVGMREFWRARGHHTEASSWTRRALDVAGAPPDPPDDLAPIHGRALVAASVHDRMAGEFMTLQARLAEAVGLARRLDDHTLLADALTQLGLSLRDRGEVAAARDHLDEAVTLWRRAGGPRGLSTALGARASVALAERDTDLARALRVEAAGVAREAGDREGEAYALIGLGEVARMEGEMDEARAYNQRCVALFGELGDAWHAAAAWQNLGWIEIQSGRDAAAAAAFSECVALFRSAGNPFGLTLCLYGFARLLHRAGDREGAAVALARAAAHAARVGVRPAAPADVVACEETTAAIEAARPPAALAETGAPDDGWTLPRTLAWAADRLRPLLGPAEPDARRHQPDRAGTERQPVLPAVSAPARPPDLAVYALGPLRILVDGAPLDPGAFVSGKPRELLLLFLCHPEGLTREQVGLAFWPEASTSQVKNSFHVTLHRLRKALGHPEWVTLVDDRYRLDPGLRIEFDAARFEAEVEAALRGGEIGSVGEARLEAALAICGGELLEGTATGDWHLEIRDRLRRLEVEGLLALAARRTERGAHDLAAEAYRAVLARDRLHELACRGLMLSQARAGQRVQAIRLYETFSLLLQEELGVVPDPETAGLYQRIQRADVV